MFELAKVKIIGAVLALGGSTMLGIIYTMQLSRRMRSLKHISEALELASAELEAHCANMPRLLAYMSKHSRGSAARFFSCIHDMLDRLGELEFEEIWSGTADETMDSLSGEELFEYKSLGAVLGRTELEAQVCALRSCGEMFRLNHARLKQELPQKRKLCLGISAGCGMLLIIVLI